jgi:hypothetical protein
MNGGILCADAMRIQHADRHEMVRGNVHRDDLRNDIRNVARRENECLDIPSGLQFDITW